MAWYKKGMAFSSRPNLTRRAHLPLDRSKFLELVEYEGANLGPLWFSGEHLLSDQGDLCCDECVCVAMGGWP